MTKTSPWAICVLLVSLAMFCGFATAQAAAQNTPAAAQTATGCLQKGIEPNGGFFLITDGGQHLELYDEGKVGLAGHIGQKVTVTGTVPKRSADQEKVSQPFEKQETGSRKHTDFQVSSLKMVSRTCAK